MKDQLLRLEQGWLLRMLMNAKFDLPVQVEAKGSDVSVRLEISADQLDKFSAFHRAYLLSQFDD